MKKITKEWRKSTEEEIRNGASEMTLEREIEIEVEDEVVVSVGFREFLNMSESELEFVKQVLSEGSKEPVLKRSSFVTDEVGNIVIKKSLWQRFLEWLKS